MRRNAKIAVIIPIYNEETVVEGVVNDVLRRFKTVICVDDGSTDGSVAAVQKTRATVVRHPLNLGQGAALQTGIDFALLDKTTQYFVTFDADGQHAVEDVVRMVEAIKKNDVDVVLGSRFLGTAQNMPWLKEKALKLAVIFSNQTSGIRLSDTHNGLRVFNRKVATRLNITMPDFSHASEIVERIAQEKFTYQELPITIAYTDYSRQKGQPLLNAVNLSFDTLISKVVKR